jgi:hypothetical protein
MYHKTTDLKKCIIKLQILLVMYHKIYSLVINCLLKSVVL